MTNGNKTGLDVFFSFIKDYSSLLSVAFGTAAVLLISQLTSILPPWPAAALQLSAVFQLFVLIYIAQFYNQKAKIVFDRRIRFQLVIAALFTIFYFSALSMFEVTSPGGERLIRGLVCTSDAATVYGDNCPWLSREQIAQATYDSELLWTPFGLVLSRMILLTLWLAFLSSLVLVIATFVYFQRQRRAN